jgi:VanZ family protein
VPKYLSDAIIFFKRYHLPGVIWAVIILVLSTMPTNKLPNPHITNFDKLVHVTMYFILVVSTYWSSASVKRSSGFFFIIGISGAAYGLLMECFQKWFCTYRSFEWWDVVSNSTGALLGTIIWILLIQRRFAN